MSTMQKRPASAPHYRPPPRKKKKKTPEPPFKILLLGISSAVSATMISILAQERLLGFALGSALAGFVVYDQRKRIYQSISANQSQYDIRSQVRDPIFGMHFRSQFALMWNKAVDQTFGPVVASLTSRRQQ